MKGRHLPLDVTLHKRFTGQRPGTYPLCYFSLRCQLFRPCLVPTSGRAAGPRAYPRASTCGLSPARGPMQRPDLGPLGTLYSKPVSAVIFPSSWIPGSSNYLGLSWSTSRPGPCPCWKCKFCPSPQPQGPPGPQGPDRVTTSEARSPLPVPPSLTALPCAKPALSTLVTICTCNLPASHSILL